MFAWPVRIVCSGKIGRNFSAPVNIHTSADLGTRAFLMGRDTDSFNRWERLAELVFGTLSSHTPSATAAASRMLVLPVPFSPIRT